MQHVPEEEHQHPAHPRIAEQGQDQQRHAEQIGRGVWRLGPCLPTLEHHIPGQGRQRPSGAPRAAGRTPASPRGPRGSASREGVRRRRGRADCPYERRCGHTRVRRPPARPGCRGGDRVSGAPAERRRQWRGKPPRQRRGRGIWCRQQRRRRLPRGRARPFRRLPSTGPPPTPPRWRAAQGLDRHSRSPRGGPRWGCPARGRQPASPPPASPAAVPSQRGAPRSPAPPAAIDQMGSDVARHEQHGSEEDLDELREDRETQLRQEGHAARAGEGPGIREVVEGLVELDRRIEGEDEERDGHEQQAQRRPSPPWPPSPIRTPYRPGEGAKGAASEFLGGGSPLPVVGSEAGRGAGGEGSGLAHTAQSDTPPPPPESPPPAREAPRIRAAVGHEQEPPTRAPPESRSLPIRFRSPDAASPPGRPPRRWPPGAAAPAGGPPRRRGNRTAEARATGPWTRAYPLLPAAVPPLPAEVGKGDGRGGPGGEESPTTSSGCFLDFPHLRCLGYSLPHGREVFHDAQARTPRDLRIQVLR